MGSQPPPQPHAWKAPPRRVLVIAEAAAGLTWCALVIPQDDFRRDPWAPLYALGVCQVLLLPSLFAVWQSAEGRSRRALALQLWRGTVITCFLFMTAMFAFMAAADVSAGVGIAALLLALSVGGMLAAGYSIVFGPAIWITAIAIECAARRTHGNPADSTKAPPRQDAACRGGTNG